jgi:hypothetical protein|tara:strand:- start:83 stop:208 length:126 start_codon:yes stop_codon:yes gene_type:complete
MVLGYKFCERLAFAKTHPSSAQMPESKFIWVQAFLFGEKEI